jgi:hypothetical protein
MKVERGTNNASKIGGRQKGFQLTKEDGIEGLLLEP